jgi:ABC-2 type transport system permease protein
VVGADAVNRTLAQLLREFAFKAAPYPNSRDFLRLLRAEVGPAHDALITDLFEKITLLDVKARNASARQRPDGQWEVSFTVEARKLYADGKGVETDAPMDEPFDIGVFTAEPGKAGYRREDVLLMRRQPIRTGTQTVTATVPRKPAFVGVDPYNKRIDRNADDNLVRVGAD